jgi:hypothetical protein
MFFRITNSIKKILIKELQEFFKDHPDFHNELQITNKFQFEERPKYAIIIKTATANSIKLGMDNFKGMVESYVTLANLKNKPGKMIEWVREDVANVRNLVKPGYYVVQMVEDKKFTISAYLTVDNELLDIQSLGFQQAFLKHQNINPGSELILIDTGRKLQVNVHYTIDYATGQIIFLQIPDDADVNNITVDYQYIGPTTGPFDAQPETADNVAIPGVVLAFGNFLMKDGIQVVVVYPDRQIVAKAYAGKWQINLNLSAIAQDVDTQEQLVDLAAMHLWSGLQEKLVDDGIYIDEFNLGGESEEEENATANEWAFLADLSFSVSAEWEVNQPVLGVIKKVFLNRTEDFGQYDDAELEIRDGRRVDASQRGIDYKLGVQCVENLMPYVVRPRPKYTLVNSTTQL